MIDLLLMFALAIVCFNFGWVAREEWAKHVVKRMKEELKEQLGDDFDEVSEQLDKPHVDLRLEKINDIVYAYNCEDNSFVGQGMTQTELVTCFARKYPGRNAIINEGNEFWEQMKL